jgi:hypothetical protein
LAVLGLELREILNQPHNLYYLKTGIEIYAVAMERP